MTFNTEPKISHSMHPCQSDHVRNLHTNDIWRSLEYFITLVLNEILLFEFQLYHFKFDLIKHTLFTRSITFHQNSKSRLHVSMRQPHGVASMDNLLLLINDIVMWEQCYSGLRQRVTENPLFVVLPTFIHRTANLIPATCLHNIIGFGGNCIYHYFIRCLEQIRPSIT